MNLKDKENEKDIEIITLPDNKLKIFMPPSTIGPADFIVPRSPNLEKDKNIHEPDRTNFTFSSKLEYLGSGGFSKVYKYRGDLEKKAVKKIVADPKYYSKKLTAEDSIKREIFGMTKVDCDNSLKVYGVYQNNAKDNYYILMELCDGNIEKYIKERGSPLNINETIILLFQLNKAFSLLDFHNIIHRDIKPSNILYKEDKEVSLHNKRADKKLFDGKKLNFKLGDYGVCLPLYDKSFSKSQFMGTLDFMAPEIYEMKCEKEHPVYTKKIDLFSLGQTILCLMGFIQKATTLTSAAVESLRKTCNLFNGKTKEKLMADLVFNYLLVFDVEKRADWQTYFNHPLFEDDYILKKYENVSQNRGYTVKVEKRSKNKNNSMDHSFNDNDILKKNKERKNNYSRDYRKDIFNNTFRKRSNNLSISKANDDSKNRTGIINFDNNIEKIKKISKKNNSISISKICDKIMEYSKNKNKRINSISKVNNNNKNENINNNINNDNNNDKRINSISKLNKNNKNSNNDINNDNNKDKRINSISKINNNNMNNNIGKVIDNNFDKRGDSFNNNKNNNINNKKIDKENKEKYTIRERYEKMIKRNIGKKNYKYNNNKIYKDNNNNKDNYNNKDNNNNIDNNNKDNNKINKENNINNNNDIIEDKDNNSKYNYSNNNDIIDDKDNNSKYNYNNYIIDDKDNNNKYNYNNNNYIRYETDYNKYNNNINKEKINDDKENKKILNKKIMSFSSEEEEEKAKIIPNYPNNNNDSNKEIISRVSFPFDNNDYTVEKKLTYFNPKIRNFLSNGKENNEIDKIKNNIIKNYKTNHYSENTYKDSKQVIKSKIRNLYINNNKYSNNINFLYNHNQSNDKTLYNHNQSNDNNLYNHNQSNDKTLYSHNRSNDKTLYNYNQSNDNNLYNYKINQNNDKNLYNNNNNINNDKKSFTPNIMEKSNTSYIPNNKNRAIGFDNAISNNNNINMINNNNNNIDYLKNGNGFSYFSVRNRYKMLNHKRFTNTDNNPAARANMNINLDNENKEPSLKLMNNCNTSQKFGPKSFNLYQEKKLIFGFKKNNELYKHLENDMNYPKEELKNKYKYNIQIINELNNKNKVDINNDDGYSNTQMRLSNNSRFNTSYMNLTETNFKKNDKNELKNSSYKKYYYNIDNKGILGKNIFNIRVVNDQVEENDRNKINKNNAFYFSKYSRVKKNY